MHLYKLKDGRQVPGASTIADYLKGPDAVNGLISWGHSLGKRGISWSGTRDGAADVGTAAHALVEGFCKGEAVLVPMDNPPVVRCFEGFVKWISARKIEWISHEIELVSEANAYGGKVDAVGVFQDKLVLFDWKTSSGIRKSALRQVAAYTELWNENSPRQIDGGAFVVRADKETGKTEYRHFSVPELGVAFESFLGFLEEWKRDKALDIILERSKERCMKPL